MKNIKIKKFHELTLRQVMILSKKIFWYKNKLYQLNDSIRLEEFSSIENDWNKLLDHAREQKMVRF